MDTMEQLPSKSEINFTAFGHVHHIERDTKLRATDSDSLISRLDKLTAKMDVPAFRRISIHWLNKNIGHRNADHVNFSEAVAIIHILKERGVQ